MLHKKNHILSKCFYFKFRFIHLAVTFIESDLEKQICSLNIQGFKESSWSPQNIKQNNHAQH